MPEIDEPIPEGISWGALPRITAPGSGRFRSIEYAATFQPIPRSQWHPTDRRSRQRVKTVFSQLDGHCAANAAVWALMDLRAAAGLEEVVLSPEHLYAMHSKWGTGSTLEENLDCLQNHGVCTRATMPQQNWSGKQFPQGWQEEARHYRVTEWFEVADFDYLVSAILLDWTCVIGLPWPGGGGHSVVAYDWTGSHVIGPNSWGESWGDSGWYKLTERQLAAMDSYGCWAARSCTIA